MTIVHRRDGMYILFHKSKDLLPSSIPINQSTQEVVIIKWKQTL